MVIDLSKALKFSIEQTKSKISKFAQAAPPVFRLWLWGENIQNRGEEGGGIWISELIYTHVKSGNILSCSVVDCPLFKEVIHQANPHLEIPSRRSVMRAVLSEETEVLTYSFKPIFDEDLGCYGNASTRKRLNTESDPKVSLGPFPSFFKNYRKSL